MAVAEPWVDTSDAFLRADIQRLSDAGYIHVPVNTYPLMWSGIMRDLETVVPDQVPYNLQSAYFRVAAAADHAQRNIDSTVVRFAGGSDTKQFRHFGSSYRDEGEAVISQNWVSGNFAAKASIHYVGGPDDGDNLRFDDSYLAVSLGNWVVSAGWQQRWWGPGWDTALVMSNNARSIPGVALSRNQADAFDLPVLNWFGPWTFTTFMTRLENDRYVPHALLWGARLEIRPFESLTIGFNRTAQWAGDGRPDSWSTFRKLLTGDDNCGEDGLDSCGSSNVGGGGANEPGNQLAGIDFRLTHNWGMMSTGLYGEFFAEDIGDNSDPTDLIGRSYKAGLDSQFSVWNMDWLTYVEWTDTYASDGNKAYEHQIYRTGYRFKGRSIGSTYDRDSESLVLGAKVNMESGIKLDALVRYVKLNKTDENRYQGVSFHSVSDREQKRYGAQLGVTYPLTNHWTVNVTGVASRTQTVDTGDWNNDLDGYVSAEYKF